MIKSESAYRTALFVLGIILYLFTRFWEIENFPIYFFCDEAYHQIEAQRLIAQGFRSTDGTLLPLYFEKAS